MTSFIAHLHDDLRRARLTMRGATHAAKDVPMGLHKEYARMERVMLPEPAVLGCTLQKAIEKRHSTTSSESGIALTLQDLGSLLGSALRKHDDSLSRNYPSGGALYPIETYLIATQLEGTMPGIFHYHPTAHALERLWDLPPEFEMRQIVSNPDTLRSSALIVFTSVWRRSSAKYGDFTYGVALLEAGHMSENILLLSAALDLETRPYAGFTDQELVRLLDINSELEQPVHSITLSKLSRAGHRKDTHGVLGE